MLAAPHRLRDSAQFAAVTRGRGSVRAGGPLLVVQLRGTAPACGRPPRAGFVVSRAVGGAVVRNRVKRRLRHQLAPLLTQIPNGVDLVVRATPGAATASSADLAAELRRGVERGLRRLRTAAR